MLKIHDVTVPGHDATPHHEAITRLGFKKRGAGLRYRGEKHIVVYRYHGPADVDRSQLRRYLVTGGFGKTTAPHTGMQSGRPIERWSREGEEINVRTKKGGGTTVLNYEVPK